MRSRPSCGPKSQASAARPRNSPQVRPFHSGTVQSLLFDGANSAVLLQEVRTRHEFRIALPQTGQFSDLKVGEAVHFGFDPQRAVCFPARAASRGVG